MELLINNRSLHGQFSNPNAFVLSMKQIMAMRDIANRYGSNLHCHRSLVSAQVTQQHSMQQAVQHFDRNQQRAIMQWLTQYGPFWEEARQHSSDEYLEYNGNLVTDEALGEAAFCCRHGIHRSLVSFSPSAWEVSPLRVNWAQNNDHIESIDVINYWNANKLEQDLSNAPLNVDSWANLAEICRLRFPYLTFASDCFEPLRGQPFVFGASERIHILLDLLNKLRQCFDEQGHWTKAGNRIYQEHFTGSKSWFSDSSDSEKQDFENELTFRHPDNSNKRLFCTWHGKIKSPQFRIHFSYPIRHNEPLYIVYVGPKITKR